MRSRVRLISPSHRTSSRPAVKGCFDNISHHHLLEKLRKRVADRRVTRLIGQFLKAGVLSENQFLRTEAEPLRAGLSHHCLPRSRSARSKCGTNGGCISAPRLMPTVNVTGEPRQAERATGIAWLVAVCSCGALRRRFCGAGVRYAGGFPSRRRPRWRTTCAGPQALSCRRSRRRSRP